MFREVGYASRPSAIGVAAGWEYASDFESTGVEGLMSKRPTQILWPLEIWLIERDCFDFPHDHIA